jgi:hypothetical protein
LYFVQSYNDKESCPELSLLRFFVHRFLKNIILSIDNVKATDIETVSKLINSKEKVKAFDSR